jgi:glycosyltransferase involved in cell wall biosynthesis
MDELYRPNLIAILHIHQKRLAYLFADNYICVSRNTLVDLLRVYRFVQESKCCVISNPIEAPVNLQNSIKKNPLKKAVYVGGRGSLKGFGIVQKLLQIDNEITLTIIGSKLTKKELQFLDPFLPRIKVYSRVDDEKLRSLLRNCDFLFYPSLYEGFGMPPLEALALGIPSLVSDRSALKELYANSMFSYFNPEYTEELEYAYFGLDRLDWTNRVEYLQRFESEFISNQYIRFFEKCLI